VAKATRISDRMIAAAAEAVARTSNAGTIGAALLPPMDDLRSVSAAVAIAVAKTAADEGLAQADLHDPIQQVHDAMWRPEYPRLEL
jgi:malate dehydrogenase (oxaloacetate-decarboxylating)